MTRQEWRLANIEKAREIDKRYKKTHKEIIAKRQHLARIADPERFREKYNRWARKHWDAYYETNKEKIIARSRQQKKSKLVQDKSNTRYRSIPSNRLNKNMGLAIWRSLRDKKAGRPWESLVNYTISQLIHHIEKLFTDGMSWDQYMLGNIHIDHKIPLSAFNIINETSIDFKLAWSLQNLQPLWKQDNLKKSAKLSMPFQPSLF